MKLTRNKIFTGILIFGLIANLLVYFNVQNFYLRAIFSFIFLTTIPGLLTMLMLRIRKVGFWEYLVYSIGLSIAFLMFGGLSVNWALPLAGISQPLSLYPISISFYSLLLIFGLVVYLRNKDISYEFKFVKQSLLNWVFSIIPVIFPILSIFGAISLNNNGPNYLTMIVLGGIASYVFFAILLKKKLNKNIYPWAIWMMSISLLLMYSLRSWHILGWDINQEYLVFTLTNAAKHWSVNVLDSAYNLCVSITILPTILASFSKVNNEYIYKLIFPIIFSITPLAIYSSARRFLKEGYAFLSSFFFISSAFFIEQMPALARQEIALFYFAGIFMLLFDTKINSISKSILLIIFGISIPLSHYSTAYVWIALMVIYYSVSLILKRFMFKKLSQCFSLKYIIFMIVLTFVWESQLATASNNFVSFITSTITTISKGLSSDMINGGFDRLLFKNLNINNIENVTNNYQKMTKEYQNKGLLLYAKEKYLDYFPEPVSSEKLVPLVQTKRTSIIINLLKIIKLSLVNILPFIGILCLSIKYFFKVGKCGNDDSLISSHMNYLLICVCTLPLMLLIIFIPIMKIEYNITRLYIQSLVVLSSLTIFGGLFLLSKIKSDKVSSVILGTTLVLFFLYSTGFIFQVIGGEPLIQLNNFGGEYDMFYISQSDVNSAEWLAKTRENSSSIYADEVAGLRLTSFGLMVDYKYDILPSTIDVPSYVYLSKTNVQKGKVYKRYEIDFLAYTTPIKFLNENKNLIYNNGGSEIFK